MEDGESVLNMSSVVLVDQDLEPYVLEWPGIEEEDGSLEGMCLALLKREEGILLAVPPGLIPDAILAAGNAGADGAVGVSKAFTVPSSVMDGGRYHPTGSQVDLIVVDCAVTVLGFMRPMQEFEEIALTFDSESPSAVPDPVFLMPFVMDWIQDVDPGLPLAFYSAEEREGTETGSVTARASPKVPARKARRPIADGPIASEKAKPKKATTASLAASLEEVVNTLPALSSQIQDLATRQITLESKMLVPTQSGLPALNRPLSHAISGPQASQQALASMIQTPPRRLSQGTPAC